ncbi:MAG: arsenate reductase ArsC [Bdellovibrionaceae bacterium]|nr:arsenate reductase ArsC [Pseudobdellovibrionaceae bacterium]
MKILFMCVANSARSQMAEGLARHYLGNSFEIYSAGSQPSRLNPLAVKSMTEIGIDISKQSSKSLDDIPLDKIDLIITLCHEEVCPIVPNRCQKEHWPFPDPANSNLSQNDQLKLFRTVRENIRKKIQDRWLH